MNGLLSSVSEPKGLNLQTRPEGFFPWKPQRDVRRRLGIPLTPEEEAEIASAEAVDLPDDPNLTPEENAELKQSAIAVIQNKAIAEAEAEEAIKLGEVSATKDPAKLEQFRKEGYELSEDQQRILWDVEQKKPLTQKAGEFVSAIGPAAVSMVADIGEGAYSLGKEGLADIAGATGESEEYAKKQFEEAGQAYRSFGSGVIGGLEDIVINLPTTMIAGGTPITDYIAEQFGRSPDKSFQNFLAREDVRRQLAEEQQKYPERTSRMLQRLGETLGLENFAQEVAENALTRDQINQKIAVLGDVLAFDIPFTSALSRVAAKPVTRGAEALGGAIVGRELAGVRLGVAPALQATGYGIRRGGEKIDEIAGRIDQYFTGSPDWLFRNAVGKTARLVTKPAAAVEAVGELGIDIGRATDLGWAGRQGVFERIGTSPDSGVIANTLFGDRSKLSMRKVGPMTPEEIARNVERLGSQIEKNSRSGLQRARALDSASRLTQYYANSGISGAAVQAILGLPNLETWGAAGEMVGSGIGIGTLSASSPGALFGTRVAMDQRRAAEADIRRMYDESLGENTKKGLSSLYDTDQFVQRSEGRLAFLQMRKELLEEIIKSGQNYQQGDVNITPQDAETELFEINEKIVPRIEGEIDAVKKGGKRAADEIKFLVDKEFMDTLGNLKITADKAGLGGDINVQLASTEEITSALRELWAPTIKTATETVQALEGLENISPEDSVRLQRAKETLTKAEEEINNAPTRRGFSLDPKRQPVPVPTIYVNTDRLQSAQGRDLPRVLRHEMFHGLLQFKEVQDIIKPYTDQLFDQYAMDINGKMSKIGDGMVSDAALSAMADNYSSAFDPLNKALWKDQFESPEELKNAIKEEFLADLFNFSGGELGMTSQIEDSVVQNFIDMVKTKESNSTIGRIRDGLAKLGIETNDDGVVSDVLGELPSEALALMRQFRRELRDNSGSFMYEGDPNLNAPGELTFAKIAASPALRNRYKDADFWAQEAATTIYGPDGKVIRDVVLNKRQANQAKIGEWIVQNGQLAPANPETGQAPRGLIVASKGQPDGTRIVVGVRTAKDAEGNPKVLSSGAVEAASRQRGRMIRDAFDNAPDDGSPNRLRDTGNGNYRGTMSPSQVQAVMEIPDVILPPSMKRHLLKINDTLTRADGTRNTIEYQAALRGGKYRGMAPRISDEVFIGFQFSKQDNFLVTSVSVTRLNNKIDSWLKDKPQRLSLWGGSKYDMWVDFRRYLANQQQNRPGEKDLSSDPAVAVAKKNVLNDLLNLYTKETEGANPDRTRSKTRKGQDSVDRTIASRRLDRILQMEENSGDKLPLNYGKIISNALPAARKNSNDAIIKASIKRGSIGPKGVTEEQAREVLNWLRDYPAPEEPDYWDAEEEGDWEYDLMSDLELADNFREDFAKKGYDKETISNLEDFIGADFIVEDIMGTGAERAPKKSRGSKALPAAPPINRKAWITPDGEIVNVDPGSEHRFVARSLFPDAESDEKAQMAAEDEGYLRVVRDGNKIILGSMRTPNRFQLRELKNLAEENGYEIENDRGRNVFSSRALPAAPQGKQTFYRFFDQHQRGTSTKIGEFVIKVEAESPEEADRLIKKSPEYIAAAARSNVIPTSEVEALPPEEDLWRPEIKSKALPETLFRAGSFNEASGRGVFLTSKPKTAESYSREGQREVSSYKLPEDANLFDAENRWKLVSEIDPKWDKEKVYDKEVKKGMIGDSSPEQRLEIEAEKRIKKILSEIGYDGVRYSGGVTDQAGEFQIFNPNLLEKSSQLPTSKALPDIANRSDLDDAVASKLTRKGVRDQNIRDWFMKSYIKEFLQAPLEVVKANPDNMITPYRLPDENPMVPGIPVNYGRRANVSPYYVWPDDPDWKKKEGMQRFGSFTLAENDWIDHMIDWMNTLPESERKKLYKQTRAQVDAKVVEWSEKMANKKVSQLENVEVGKDIKPVKKFPDGYSVVELLSDGAYREEGNAMGHCVGSYCSESDTYNKYRKIYSLRDSDGNPHATIEVIKDLEDYAQEEIRKSVRAYKAENPDARVDEEWAMDTFGDDVYQEIFGDLDPYAYAESDKRAVVMQIKGKANSKVQEKYAKYVREFFRSGPGRKIAIMADGENIGLNPRARNFGVSNRLIYPDTKKEISPEDSSLWDSGDRYIVPQESEFKKAKPSSKALPAAIFGDFYHGTDSDIARKIDRGSEFSARGYGEYKSVKVIYVSPSKEGAMEFSGNDIDGILSTKLRNRNIFNPADKGDTKKLIDALVPYMEIYDSDLTEKQLQKEAERMAKEIANEISGEGRDKDSGWQEVERYADVIKEAGFDGYVAWEDGNPMIGFYPDKIEYNFKKLPEPPLGTVKL